MLHNLQQPKYILTLTTQQMETTILYVVALLCVSSIVITTTLCVISLVGLRRGIREVYGLFDFLHKESEQRIGRANLMVSECTNSIKESAQSAKECANASQNMIKLTDKIIREYDAHIERLRNERDKANEECARLRERIDGMKTGTNVEFKTYN